MFKLVRDHRGGVTVFVTLILVPSVLFVGFMIDIARYSRYGQMLDAMNQSTGNAALSNYDGLLKDTYGLFGRKAMEQSEQDELANYAWAAMYPSYNLFENAPDGTEGTFDIYKMGLYQDILIKNEPKFSLTAGPHLQNQIADYMKYRAAVSLFKEGELVLDDMESLTQAGEDSKAIKSKSDLDKVMAQMNSTCEKLYWHMVANDRFDREFEQYNNTDDGNIVNTTRDSTVRTVNAAATDIGKALDDLNGIDDVGGKERELASLSKRLDDLEDEDDIDSCKKDIAACEEEIEDLRESINEHADEASNAIQECIITMGAYEKNLTGMDSTVKSLKNELKNADEALKKHREDLKGDVSSEMKKSMEKELEEYQKLLDSFSSGEMLSQQIATNTVSAKTVIAALKAYTYSGQEFGSIGDGKRVEKDTTTRYELPEVSWLPARTESVFSIFEGWYAGTGKPDKGKDKAQKDAQKKLNEELNKESSEQPKGAAYIPHDIALMLGTPANNSMSKDFDTSDAGNMVGDIAGNVSDAADSTAEDMSGIFGGSSAGQVLTSALDKVLLVEYDLGMFSCATSGMGEHGKTVEQETINGIPLSTKLNYLYQSELEYLLAGGEVAMLNRAAAGGSIYSILFIRDFAYSYTAKANLNTSINTAAIAIGAGNPMAVAVARIALRTTVTGMESGGELRWLLKGNKIPLLKTGWKYDLDGILTGGSFQDGVSTGTIDMDYPDFMRVLLLMFVDRPTILKRTANLIELNINNYKAGCNADESKMTAIPYRLADQYVAFRVEHRFKASFIFNTLEFFDIENTLEDTYWSINTYVGY